MMNQFNMGYNQKDFGQPTKRYCQHLELRNDIELIKSYRAIHNKENSWPEISAGIRAVGILEMEIYIFDNHLFMIVDTALDFDWDSSFSRLATMDRQQEWENYVSQFQVTSANATSSEKWMLMERIFSLLPQTE